MWEVEIPIDSKPLGYKKLVELFAVEAIAHFRWSYVSPKWDKKEFHFNDPRLSLYIYPCSYALSDNVFEHLEFALKHEGINLYILKKVLTKISEREISEYLKGKLTRKYVRILWFLYEKFNNVKLSFPDIHQGSYVLLLDPKQYYTSNKPKRSSRHRVSINLLGSMDFAPSVRKTSCLKNYEKSELGKKAHHLIKKYDASLLSRAMKYLYTKETMSSWEIEKEKPDNSKLAKFVGLLHKADSIGPLSEKTLVDLQKDVVDPRFSSSSYRDFQNYVGEEPGMGQLILHYIPPKPENVSFFMENLIHSFELMENAKVPAVIIAAVLSFGFVYIHPFEDGNGRVHRFLIHYCLARLGFTPERVVFPISAVIARDQQAYDNILEIFSKPLLGLITNYKVSEIGELKVLQDTADYYRYIDFTPVAEYLFECVDKTIITDFQEELSFLAGYDKIKRLCKNIVDMPDQRMDLFIKCVRQNNGTLSFKKKESYFPMLTDEEIKQMEEIIRNID